MSDLHHPSQAALARATGLSRSTVSRALSNHIGTSEKTKELVRRTAEQLGYKRNAVVSMLTAQVRMNRLHKVDSTLAYITTLPSPNISRINATYYGFYEGAKKRAEELGYGLDVIWRSEDSMTSERFTKILLSRGIRGLLIAPRPNAFGHIRLDWSKFAAVSIGHPLPAPHIHWVGAWHYKLMERALREVGKLGYRRVGFAVFPYSDRYTSYAFSSRYLFSQTLMDKRDRIPLLYRPTIDETVDFPQFKRWFHRYRPEVLLGAGSRILPWLKEMNLSVPKDVAYVDLCLESDDGTQAGIFEMPEVIAANAVELVVEQIHHNHRGAQANPKAVLVEGKWVHGETLPPQKAVGRESPSHFEFPEEKKITVIPEKT